MAYKKTNWQDTLRDAQGNVIQKGTPLNAQALGKIEDGIVQAEQKIDTEIQQVTTQLAQNVDFMANQIDFVRLLQENNEVASKLFVKVKSDRTFDVLIPFKGKKSAHFEFKKDTNDDFIKIGDIKVSHIDKIDTSIMANFGSIEGSFNTSGGTNYYANPSSVGTAKMHFSFEGTGLDFQHRADPNGGVWEFVVDGDTANAVRISTHIGASPSALSTKTVFRGLANSQHTVVATFIGDDPLNPPSGGTGTSRGWLSRNDGNNPGRETFKVYGSFDDIVIDFTINTGSNKEFAISHGIFTGGSTWSATHWIPEHNAIGTAFKGSQRIFFDDEEITNWTPNGKIREVKSIRIIQQLYGRHPEAPGENTAEVNVLTTISSKGVSVQAKFKALRDLFIEGGHVLMLVADNTFANQLVTSYGKRYDATIANESREDLAEDDRAMSYAFINNSGTQDRKDTVLAVSINNIADTFRWGQPNRKPDGMVWLQHRATLQKLYPHVMRSHVMKAGEEYELSGIYFVGEIPMAGLLLPNK